MTQQPRDLGVLVSQRVMTQQFQSDTPALPWGGHLRQGRFGHHSSRGQQQIIRKGLLQSTQHLQVHSTVIINSVTVT